MIVEAMNCLCGEKPQVKINNGKFIVFCKCGRKSWDYGCRKDAIEGWNALTRLETEEQENERA